MGKLKRLYPVRKAIINTHLSNWSVINKISTTQSLLISPSDFYNLVGFVGILTGLDLTEEEREFVRCLKVLNKVYTKEITNE